MPNFRSAARFGLLTLAALCGDGATAASSCRVFDPELQGDYRGGCKDGLAEGEGVARGMAEYRGGFHAGKKEGQGIKTWPWGDRYQGGFADDRKEGEGRYTWAVQGGAVRGGSVEGGPVRNADGRAADAQGGAGEGQTGESYSGHFHADRRDGMGTYTWTGGEAYHGRWADDWPLDPIDGALFDRLRAQARAAAEARAALGVPGVKACRALPLGISEREWIAGEVIAVLGDAVAVKIVEKVTFPLTLNGVEVAQGALIWDTAWQWRRCF